MSVRLELQADFLAGVWAHYAQQKGILEPGDIEEALGAASAGWRRPAAARRPGLRYTRLVYSSELQNREFAGFEEGWRVATCAREIPLAPRVCSGG